MTASHRERIKARGTNTMTLEGQTYSLPNKCATCGKAIFVGKQCYGCSKGKPRRFVRPEERGDAA